MTGDTPTGVATSGPYQHLADTPWPAEDGGPTRPQRPRGLSGPRAGRARLGAVRQAPLSVMALLAPDGGVLVLRNSIGPEGVSWVEQVDPESLDVLARSPDLALGPYWPGGMAVLADGAVVVTQGRHVHRLGADLVPEVSRELAVDAPHNSFVVLADGSLALKDLQFPGATPSTLSVLDPVDLTDCTEPLVLPEASVARLSASGNDVVVVGIDALHRIHWDPDSATMREVGHPRTYRDRPDQSYGWDPVVDGDTVWWLDNGDHTFPDGLTMLDNGVAAGPLRLWRANTSENGSNDGGKAGESLASVEVCGAPRGAVTNPPVVDPQRNQVVAYDSANGVLAAFDATTLGLRWRVALRTATHLVVYPDTGELIANDFSPDTGDAVVTVNLDDGAVRTRTPVDSPAQSVVFGCPGRNRDYLYVSLSTLARVVFDD